MDITDLTPAQVECLFAPLDRQRQFLERLYGRCLTNGFPEDDHLRVAIRHCLIATRELVLTVNDLRSKGLSRRVQRASRSWPRV